MDISSLPVETLRDVARAIFTQYPALLAEVLSSLPASASKPAIPDSPDSPDASPRAPSRRPSLEVDEMEVADDVSHTSDEALGSGSESEPDNAPLPPSSSSDDGFVTVDRRKRKLGKKGKSESVAKTPNLGTSPPLPSHNATPATAAIPAAPATATTPTAPAPLSSPRKERPPPPIFLREKAKWANVEKLLSLKGIHFVKAQSVKESIKLQLQTSDDHRRLTTLLRSESIGFHTYALECEKSLRVVIRGLPAEFDPATIRADLESQGFPIREVHRMYSGRDKRPFDLVLVILDLSPEGKKIFGLKTVCRLSGLSVEAPFRLGPPGQCHRCQLYGHSARNCNARPRCVKCLGDHGTADCKRSRDDPTPPSCVLCNAEGHTANYRGCPKAPRASNKARARAPERFAPSAPQYTKTSSKVSTVPYRPPTTSAWAKPLAYTSVAPKAKTCSPPLPRSQVPTRAPAPTPLPSPRPSKPGQSAPAAASAGFLGAAPAVDFGKVTALLRKLSQAQTALEKLMILSDHQEVMSSLDNLSFKSQ